MLQKFIRASFLMVIVMAIGCSDSTVSPKNPPRIPEAMSFSLVDNVTAGDSIIRIRVTWNRAEDVLGAADFYRHTMTASKTVTSAQTGPLPTLKQVNGLADTVTIKVAMANDSVTLVSKVWSVRRGLQSESPAQGILFVRRGDKPPPAPDSVRVDTITVPIMGNIASSEVLTKVPLSSGIKSIIPFKRENGGATLYTIGNTTILTLVK